MLNERQLLGEWMGDKRFPLPWDSRGINSQVFSRVIEDVGD